MNDYFTKEIKEKRTFVSSRETRHFTWDCPEYKMFLINFLEKWLPGLTNQYRIMYQAGSVCWKLFFLKVVGNVTRDACT